MKRKNLEYADAHRRVEAELLPGEELLWVGQPKSRSKVRGKTPGSNKAAVLSIIVGLQVLLVLGGAFFSISSSSTSSTTSGAVTTTQETPWVMIVIIALGVLVGVLAMVFVLLRSWRSRDAVYAITDRRALTIRGGVVRSDGEQDIEFIERKMHRDGTGDIIFRRERQTTTGYYGGSVFAPQTHTVDVGFFGIPDPHEVEALMLEVFRPDHYPRKRKHDETYWDDGDDSVIDDFSEDELENLINKASSD